MKLKIRQLIGWVLIFEIVNDPVRRLAEKMDFNEFITGYSKNPMLFAYFFSFVTAFGLLSILVYLTYYKFYQKKNSLFIFISIFFATVVGIFIRYFIEEKLFYWVFGRKNYRGDYDWSYYFFDNLYYAILYIAIGIIFFFFQYAKYAEQQKKNLELENKKSELSFLKSQVNPHFLFNNLNNLYSLVYHQSDNALKFIEKLSNLLRYSLYEKEELVSLEKELKYLNDLIDLESLRYDFEIFIYMDMEEGLEQIKIAPLLFVPFIENAFKHGVLNDKENPVIISLKKEGKNLHFKVNNKIKYQNLDGTGGIGLNNIAKRLELIYGGNYIFDTDKSKGEFKINLQLTNIC
jgi:two-component system LytT family sensor kinase